MCRLPDIQLRNNTAWKTNVPQPKELHEYLYIFMWSPSYIYNLLTNFRSLLFFSWMIESRNQRNPADFAYFTHRPNFQAAPSQTSQLPQFFNPFGARVQKADFFLNTLRSKMSLSFSSSGWWAGLDPKNLPQELCHGFSAIGKAVFVKKLHYPGNRTQNQRGD